MAGGRSNRTIRRSLRGRSVSVMAGCVHMHPSPGRLPARVRSVSDVVPVCPSQSLVGDVHPQTWQVSGLGRHLPARSLPRRAPSGWRHPCAVAACARCIVPYRGEDRSSFALDSLFTRTRRAPGLAICTFVGSITLYLAIFKRAQPGRYTIFCGPSKFYGPSGMPRPRAPGGPVICNRRWSCGINITARRRTSRGPPSPPGASPSLLGQGPD